MDVRMVAAESSLSVCAPLGHEAGFYLWFDTGSCKGRKGRVRLGQNKLNYMNNLRTPSEV